MPFARIIDRSPASGKRHELIRTGPLFESLDDVCLAPPYPRLEFSGAHFAFRDAGSCEDGAIIVEILARRQDDSGA